MSDARRSIDEHNAWQRQAYAALRRWVCGAPCPYCGAAPGWPCVTIRGGVKRAQQSGQLSFHVDRWNEGRIRMLRSDRRRRDPL